ncbi:MAG: glycosyltransferase family 2 protein [Rikenellaceae bacterium]
MERARISVVVPIYNVEEYIRQCLETIISQTYSNLEIILVDDGSPDGCGAICDEYAAQDGRMRVFHIPNGGVAKARQYGVERSTGNFIIFVDPDDLLPQDSVERLFEQLTPDVDIVVGGHNKFYKSGKVKRMTNPEEVVSREAWIDRILRDPQTNWVTPWGRIYRRELFTSDSFPIRQRGQDLLMNLEVATRARGVKVISPITYNYRAPLGLRNVKIFDLEYIKGFCEVIEIILQRGEVFSQYEMSFRCMQLTLLKRSVMSKCTIDTNDAWVREVIANVEAKSLPVELRGIYEILKSGSSQWLFRRTQKIKTLIKKIIRIK